MRSGRCPASRRAAVAGYNVHHPVGHNRTCDVDGSAATLKAVDSLELVRGVVIPDDLAVVGGIGPQVAVHGAGKDGAGNAGHRGRLRGTAVRTSAAAGRRRLPDALAIIDAEGEYPAAFGGIELVLAIVGAGQQGDFEIDVRERGIEIAPVGASSPFECPRPFRLCRRGPAYGIWPFLSGSMAYATPDFCPGQQCAPRH